MEPFDVRTPRRIDDLGRVVIPAEMRRELGLRCGEDLDVRLEDGGVVIAKMTPTCVFCGEVADLLPTTRKRVCVSCVEAAHLLVNAHV